MIKMMHADVSLCLISLIFVSLCSIGLISVSRQWCGRAKMGSRIVFVDSLFVQMDFNVVLCFLFSEDALRRRLSYLLPMGRAADLDVDITALFND
jgi:hypothetical protein